MLCFLLISVTVFSQKPATYSLTSPGKKISISIQAGAQLSWAVQHENTVVLAPSLLALHLDNGEVLGRNVRVQKAGKTTYDNFLGAPFYKKIAVRDHYNQLELQMKGGFSVVFRAYDDGVAYRFLTNRKDSFRIENEEASVQFSKNHKGWFAYAQDPRMKWDQFQTSFEGLYNEISISQIPKDTLAFLPVLVELGDGKKLAVLESDLQNYPGMYLQKNSGNSLTGRFAPYPVKETIGGHNRFNMIVTERASYMAKLPGRSEMPWRVFIISVKDHELLNSDMVYRLAAPPADHDHTWIRPGKVAWDWWNDWNISGVDFKAGINTATYKHYIDFAAANGLEYIIMDEGWSAIDDLFKINTSIKLDEIISYGKTKDVGVILWATWRAVDAQMEKAFPHYQAKGVKGFKIDFLDRDDQPMVASTYAIAKKAAEHHLLINYHGMFKPAGIQRTYPNVVNFEGVKGLENAKWAPSDDVPRYDVSIPFIRMLAGPMDYTPGAMRNANKWNFRPVHSMPMSQGTRAHQVAMYVVYEAPLQMLADNPTAYRKEQATTDFISKIPTVFDETVALDGKVGEFVVMARRKGDDWFIAAMSNWDGRTVSVDLSFLPEEEFEAQIFSDGVNADRDATDHKIEKTTLNNKQTLTITLAPGGGWVARLTKKS